MEQCQSKLDNVVKVGSISIEGRVVKKLSDDLLAGRIATQCRLVAEHARGDTVQPGGVTWTTALTDLERNLKNRQGMKSNLEQIQEIPW